MEMQHKTIARMDWPRILERAQAYLPIEEPHLRGMACLLCLKRVKSPLVSGIFGDEMVILDDGYHWLQIAPEGANWWLSVMFDTQDRLIQYYFDVSCNHDICGEASTFDDLFLDVVMTRDGRLRLLDQDELDEALAAGVIDREAYALAFGMAGKLLQDLPGQRAALEAFCYRYLQRMKPMLAH